MEIEQLELDLWRSLETASQFPETADLRSLCAALDQMLTDKPVREQLQVAGEVLMQLSDVYAARAEWLIAGWEHRHQPTEPIVDLETCVDLFVQSLSLDVTALFDEPEPVQYPANRKQKTSSQEEGSVVGDVDKEALLNWLDQTVAEPPLNETQMVEQIRDLAHGENVEAWSRAIAQYLTQVQSTIRLTELQRKLDMPMVEVWLGLLIGEYYLEQQGEFYNPQNIWITNT